MSDIQDREVTRQEKIEAVLDVARYHPRFVALILGLGMLAAVFDGVGMTFIVPIIEIVQAEDPVAEAEGVMLIFVNAYQMLGIPFSLGFVVLGVTTVMTLRYTTSFFVGWFRDILRIRYRRHLQIRLFDAVLDARIGYFDEKGSDEILNTVITESYYSSRAIKNMVKMLETVFLTLVYLVIAFFIAPLLTVFAIVALGVMTVIQRVLIESGYSLGDRVAKANEEKQQAAQAATLGIRDIRAFGLESELYNEFSDAVERFTRDRITVRRNEVAIKKFYNLAVAVFVFVLIYVALTFANLSFGALGLFLFAMFRLGPQVSEMNSQYYKIEEKLPHIVRTRRFLDELERSGQPQGGDRPAPSEVESVEFDDVWFSYDEEEDVLRGVDFEVDRGEFVAFVGQSGAGKSTIVSLLARYYEPNRGRILANDAPIGEMDPDEWRERIAIVRQDPFIFNDTLRYNLTIGNRDATEREIERACEIACVDEFLDDLSDGLDTRLGDEAVQLSGGQKQRVALARALLEDADLLILDEATSDLDSNLEQQVQREIESMERDYAIVTIAHQLSTVENADRIYTLEDGQILERGDHGKLVDRGGKYAELYEIQSTH